MEQLVLLTKARKDEENLERKCMNEKKVKIDKKYFFFLGTTQ